MKQTFPATLAGLEDCQRLLYSLCQDPKPQIITDEIVSNIVRCSGSREFTVDFEQSANGELTMQFIDQGVAFDPTAVAEPDVTLSVAERPIGGLGLMMVRRMARSVRYERRGNENILTVVLG